MTEAQEGEFAVIDAIKERKQAYMIACNTPGMQRLLIDLAHFCHAADTCVMIDKQGRVDDSLTRMREGRREVWLRIEQHLNLNSKQLYRLYTGRQFNPGDENG